MHFHAARRGKHAIRDTVQPIVRHESKLAHAYGGRDLNIRLSPHFKARPPRKFEALKPWNWLSTVLTISLPIRQTDITPLSLSLSLLLYRFAHLSLLLNFISPLLFAPALWSSFSPRYEPRLVLFQFNLDLFRRWLLTLEIFTFSKNRRGRNERGRKGYSINGINLEKFFFKNVSRNK